MNNIKMNKQLGTKWFTFYTKVRPWLVCLASIPFLKDFIQYSDVYFASWWTILYFLSCFVPPILAIIIFIKSIGDYQEFVRLVKGVLLAETFCIAYQQGIQQYLRSFEIGYAVINFLIILVLAYFLWYRLNIKYFEKRLNVITNDYLEDDPNRITQCKSCGYQNKDYFDACPKCGKYAKQYIYLNENSSADKNNAEDTSSFPDLDIDKMTPQEAAEYLVAEQIHRTRTQESQEVREQGVALYCTHCGKSLITNSNFCAYCGTQIYHKK